jgi:uncharacterized protein (DUF2237 family)
MLCCRIPSALPAVQELSLLRKQCIKLCIRSYTCMQDLQCFQFLLQDIAPRRLRACPFFGREGCCTSSRAECTFHDSVCSFASWGTAMTWSFASHSKCSARDLSSGRLHAPFAGLLRGRWNTFFATVNILHWRFHMKQVTCVPKASYRHVGLSFPPGPIVQHLSA